MLPSIPVSNIVQINPSALGTGGNALALNSALLHVSSIYPVQEYFDAESVGDDYGTTSDLFKYAQTYFRGFTGATRLPSSMFIAKYNATDVSARLIGASLRNTTLEEIQAVNGVLTVTIDGTQQSGTVDLSTATSFSNAASLIATALTITCTFDSQIQAFIISSATTGEASSISFASGSASAVLGLSQDAGATTDNATVADTPDSAMERLTSYTLNFATFTYAPNAYFTVDVAKELAKWNTAQNNQYWFVQYGKEPTALIPNSDVCFGAWLKETNQGGTTAIYGDVIDSALAGAYAASIDFSATNGRVTLDFRGQDGIEATVTDVRDANALTVNGYAFYGAFAARGQDNRFLMMRNSVVSGQFEWVDTYLNQVYFNSQLQLALITMLIQQKSVPYNAVGKSMQRAACQDPINEMLNFGGIQTGILLSEQQKSVINTSSGFDAASQIFTTGWTLIIKDATTQVRGQRGSMPITLYYTDGGSIHNITLNSIAVL